MSKDPKLMRLILSTLIFTLGFNAVTAQQSDPAFVAAIQLADDGDYEAAFASVDEALSRDVLTWMQLRSGVGAFSDFTAFIEDHPTWPAMLRLRAGAERVLEKQADPDLVIAWFADNAPETGEGAVRLAEALTKQGQPDAAKDVIVAAWLDLRLGTRGQAAILDTFADVVAPHHADRADNLLWRWLTDEAALMLPLLDEDQSALVLARIAYIRKRGIPEAVEAVPAALKRDPGLAYDRYNWLSSQGERTQAIAILKGRSTSVDALGEPFRWSGWRRVLARWEMREGRTQSAYDLASQHFLTEGSAYADLEWLSGYIALRYFEDPALALAHFNAMAAEVESPISLGRAGYWRGRAYQALGDANAAALAYAQGSDHQTSFYGLLAAEKLGMSLDPALTGRADPQDWQGADVLENDLVVAALALLEAGERGSATEFFAQLGRQLDATDTARLAALMESLDQSYYAVLLGKAAVLRGIIVPSAYFPMHGLRALDLPVETALSLSIARRESEFNAGAGSPVGALGLMQLMPATAQEVAGFLDLPYSKARLTADWTYNAQLGAKYLAILSEEFGESPVQIAAGYNAGPSRPRRWMDERGDPRLGEVDVVDWIEHIPFRETRNYVMRVTESIPVYRARLTGQTGPIAFTELLMGRKLIVRPQLRPDSNAAPEVVISTSTSVPSAATSTAISKPAAVPGIRPISRPGG
jgi:soluble lytic murein transglycosylase